MHRSIEVDHMNLASRTTGISEVGLKSWLMKRSQERNESKYWLLFRHTCLQRVTKFTLHIAHRTKYLHIICIWITTITKFVLLDDVWMKFSKYQAKINKARNSEIFCNGWSSLSFIDQFLKIVWTLCIWYKRYWIHVGKKQNYNAYYLEDTKTMKFNVN